MLPNGKILRNRYHIIKSLGSGNFSITYQAQDLDLPGNPYCVVKHLCPRNNHPEFLQNAQRLFQNEAKVLYQLGNHPQIPTLFAHFPEEGEFYIVQEFIDGKNLQSEIIPGRKFPEPDVINLLAAILEVLVVAHECQPHAVIHRDLKPENLMVRPDGSIVLIDFGIVKEVTGNTNATVSFGSPGYAPIEQIRGNPQLSSDIYAVGMMGIQALTGVLPQELPIDPRKMGVVWRHLVPSLNPRLADVLDKMVAPNFLDRYNNARTAFTALMPFLPNAGENLAPTIPYMELAKREGVMPPANLGERFWQFVEGILGGESPPESATAPSIKPRENRDKNSARRTPPADVAKTINFATPKFETPKVVWGVESLPANAIRNFGFETVQVNDTGQIIRRIPKQVQVFRENLGKDINLDMVAIPGGSFQMGSNESDYEKPVHPVKIEPFSMGMYPVTQALYAAIMGTNPSHFKGGKLPVENVTWQQAVEFCRRLSQITGRNYRLPSEAEWEYACRAGTQTPFYFGETITPELVNYHGNHPYGKAAKGLSRGDATEVGIFPPNAFGLYDMHGNVWEWCSDRWHKDYNGAPTDGSSWETGTVDDMRVIRGGSWDNYAVNCRSANRNRDDAGNRVDVIGFRVVVS